MSNSKYFVVFIKTGDTPGGYLNTEEIHKNSGFRLMDSIEDACTYTESSFNKQWFDNHLASRFINSSVHIIGITNEEGAICPDSDGARVLANLLKTNTDDNTPPSQFIVGVMTVGNGGIMYLDTNTQSSTMLYKLTTVHENATVHTEESFNKIWFERNFDDHFKDNQLYILEVITKEGKFYANGDSNLFVKPIKPTPSEVQMSNDQSTSSVFPCVLVITETQQYVCKAKLGYSSTSEVQLASVFNNRGEVNAVLDQLPSDLPTSLIRILPYADIIPTKRPPLQIEASLYELIDNSDLNELLAKATKAAMTHPTQKQFVIYVSMPEDGIMYINTDKPYTGLLSILTNDFNNATVFTEEEFNKVWFEYNLAKHFKRKNVYKITVVIENGTICPISECAEAFISPAKQPSLQVKTPDDQSTVNIFPCVLTDLKKRNYLVHTKSGYEFVANGFLAKIFNNQEEIDLVQDEISPKQFRALTRVAPESITPVATNDEYVVWVTTKTNTGFACTETNTNNQMVVLTTLNVALADKHSNIEKALLKKDKVKEVISCCVMKLTKYINF